MATRQLTSLLLIACLLLAPAAWAAPAKETADATKVTPVQEEKAKRVPMEVLTFQFEDSEGNVADFQVKDGGAIRITDAKAGLYYRLQANKDKEGRANLRLLQYADAERTQLLAEDALLLDANGNFQSSGIAPFRIKMTGTKTEMAKLVPLKDQPDNYIECCIYCGGWALCCDVEVFEPGWGACCSIGMCGVGCTICEVAY